MSHTLIISLADEVYTVLTRTAKQIGQMPETLAAQWLKAISQHLTDDPVEQFIGAIKSPVTDWADQHDAYLGKMVMETMQAVDDKGETE
ncbi:hypothetical protein U14_02905 [Candidatus Moduliflexus flocculans]|uniref:Uncharacterized protein n=1 Tax=Candidatus Moduliflexus flocculans TaxID=1499966 RepID=A0A081BMP4_9BACT|nr:hypothetical protein U14_02905 [Candidatus Moduliflexus flocculans]